MGPTPLWPGRRVRALRFSKYSHSTVADCAGSSRRRPWRPGKRTSARRSPTTSISSSEPRLAASSLSRLGSMCPRLRSCRSISITAIAFSHGRGEHVTGGCDDSGVLDTTPSSYERCCRTASGTGFLAIRGSGSPFQVTTWPRITSICSAPLTIQIFDATGESQPWRWLWPLRRRRRSFPRIGWRRTDSSTEVCGPTTQRWWGQRSASTVSGVSAAASAFSVWGLRARSANDGPLLTTEACSHGALMVST